jgi:hypothetical protein
MSESAIRNYAQAKGFRRQTLERWLAWEPSDRDALAEVALSLKISENQLREMMDWLEEISLRDRIAIGELIGRAEMSSARTDPRLGRADKIKRLKEQLRRWRFPRLATVEDAVRQHIRALKLPSEIRLSVPPGLEGGRLQAEVTAGSLTEFQRLVGRLNQVAGESALAEIFRCLSGESAGDEPERS